MQEEQLIVQKAQQGEREAFGVLYDRYLPKIYRFVLIKVSKRDDAEDITHQVFLNAWQNIRSYRHRGFPFSSWLYRIARNMVIDFYRTRRSHADIESVPEEFLVHNSGSLEFMDTKIELELVAKSIRKLKDDEQNILLLKFVDELSSKEIANIIEKSEGAVRVMQHRALKQLRSIIYEERRNKTTKEI